MVDKSAYQLINPYIEGSISTVVHASTPFSAGKKLYTAVSQYFTNSVKNFNMTIQNLDNNELSHFEIKEKMDGKNVKFDLSQIDGDFDDKINKKLITEISKMQNGGKKKESETTTSDSDSESTAYYYPVQPISRFTYFYLPYPKIKTVNLNPIDERRLFFPMFSMKVNPVFELNFDVYKVYPNMV